MACGCRDKQRRTNLKYVINLAIVLSKAIKLDTMVYKEGIYNSKTLYNFASYKSRNDIIQVISYNQI